MKLIYVAGPYTGNSIEMHRNIQCALETGVLVVKLGAYPVIPHSNTPPMFVDVGEPEFWYEGTLELMRRCDAVLMCGPWWTSKGAKAEKEEAHRLKIPVFERVQILECWILQELK